MIKGIRETVREYAEYLQIKNYKLSTIRGYRCLLEKLLSAIDSLNIKDITVKDLKKYLIGRRANVCPETIRLEMSVFNLFFIWQKKIGKILVNPMEKIEKPGPRKKIVFDVLSEKDIFFCLDKLKDKTYEDKRDKAIIETLYATGMRKAEVTNLKTRDIDFMQGILYVRNGKGGKDRLLPIGKKAIEAIRKYLEVRRIYKGKPIEELFTTRVGKAMKTGTIDNMFRRVSNILNNDLSAQKIRRTCATHMIRHGASVMHVKELLGHERIGTMRHYVQVAAKDMKAEHMSKHPSG